MFCTGDARREERESSGQLPCQSACHAIDIQKRCSREAWACEYRPIRTLDSGARSDGFNEAREDSRWLAVLLKVEFVKEASEGAT